ncbi:hypothetical protein ACFL43_02330 [Thermodesulfobacteriota bacterium]
MKRKIFAFIAFNYYALFLLSAFMENTVYLFDAEALKEINLQGLEINPKDWGWGDHYIWRLISGVIVTALVGMLAGSIAKSRGAITSVIANIPSIFIWIFFIYAFVADFIQGSKGGFITVSIIAIPLTTYIAYIFGGIGEELQKDFPDNSVLGIKGYHLIWIAFPVYWYCHSLIYVFVKYISVVWHGDESIVASIIALVMLMPVVAWIYPLVLAYNILRGEMLNDYNAVIRGLVNFGILFLGMVIATGIQVVIYWLLNKFFS